MTALVGAAIEELVTLTDDAGAPVTGATWTVLYAKTREGDVFTQADPTETATPGTYLVSLTPTSPTTYHRILKASKSGTDYYVAGSLHVASSILPFEHYVGQVAGEVVVLVDTAGAPITGASFTVETAEVPDGSTTEFSFAAVPDAAGGYLLLIAPDRVGSWSLLIATDTTPVQRFVLSVDVQAAGVAIQAQTVTGLTGRVLWTQDVSLAGSVLWVQDTSDRGAVLWTAEEVA